MEKLLTLNSILRYFHLPGDYVLQGKHSGLELVYYRTGSGTTIIDGVLYEYSSNSLAVIPPNTLHDETTVSSSEVLFCIFETGSLEFDLTGGLYAGKSVVLQDIYALLCNIENEMRLKQAFCEERVNLLLRELLVVLRRLEVQQVDNTGTVDYVKRLLKENPTRDVDFRIIAESVGYSYDRFRHLFREQTGISPSQYQLNLRIAVAKKLLADESTPLGKVAMLCGFQSVSYFVTAFRKKVNLTPMQYRKLVLQDPQPEVLNLPYDDAD